MHKDIYWICVYTLDPSRFEDFKAVVRPLVVDTKAEAGCLAYEYTISEDHSATHILEHYDSSEAVVHHVTNTFSKHAEKFLEIATVQSFMIYGSPNAEAKKILDGFGAVYFEKFDGFTK